MKEYRGEVCKGCRGKGGCRRCSGTGHDPVFGYNKKCIQCSGSGKCSRCRGSGFATHKFNR